MPEESSLQGPDVMEVAAALRVSIGLLLRRMRQVRPDGELSLPEMSALARLDRTGPATSGTLAKLEQISPQSMGATLAGLEARGLVAAASGPRGRPAGRAVADRGRAAGAAGQAQRPGRAAGPGPVERLHARGAPPARRLPHCSSDWRRPSDGPAADAAGDPADDRYHWVALANTTAAMFMATLDGSIVIIALPAIFRGIHLDPLAAGNISYLLWMIMGYRLVQAVLVVSLGRLGDMFGRVKIYNAGFAVFTAASILLSFDPFQGAHGALWLIGWRVLQAVGGSMLMANSAAILTDAFPAERRGFALGTNQVAGLAGQFVGLVAGGLLAAIDWRAVFWVNVPVGVFGTVWAYRKLRDNGERHPGRIDWWGNVTFAVGLSAVLIAITEGIQPYGHHSMGWANPAVLGLLTGGAALLAVFVVIETRIADPMFQLSLFRIRAFTAGSIAGLAGRHRPRRHAVHAHHLAAGHLAAAARLRLQRHPAVGRDLPAAADRGLPGLGAGLGHPVRPVRLPRPRHRRDDRVRRQLHRPDAAAR